MPRSRPYGSEKYCVTHTRKMVAREITRPGCTRVVCMRSPIRSTGPHQMLYLQGSPCAVTKCGSIDTEFGILAPTRSGRLNREWAETHVYQPTPSPCKISDNIWSSQILICYNHEPPVIADTRDQHGCRVTSPMYCTKSVKNTASRKPSLLGFLHLLFSIFF